MAKVLLIGGRTADQGASLTRYDPVLDASRSFSPFESDAQVTMRTAGVFSDLWCNISSNNRQQSTLRFRVNGADGNQAVTITASTTGQFEDTTNTDSIAAGDEVSTSLVTGSGGTSFIMATKSHVFTATSGTVKKMGLLVLQPVSTASASSHCALGGFQVSTAGEGRTQLKQKVAGTFANFFANVTTNARSTTSTLSFRVNGANGNQVISVTAGATGFFEDTSNSDSVLVDDLVNLQVTLGTGTGNFTLNCFASEFAADSAKFHLVTSHTNVSFGPIVLNAGATNYYPAGGRPEPGITTEAGYRTDAQFAFTVSQMACFVISNTLTADSTFRARVNGADGNQVVTIGAGVTGLFEDTTNSDVLAASDEINYQAIGGATGTSIGFTVMSMLATVPSFVPYPFSRGARGGIGAMSGGMQ